MPQGLSVARLINVTLALAPVAAALANFNSLLIMGNTPGVIDTYERMRSYNGIQAVASDFGTTAPEYLAASLFFGQIPQPTQLYIGFWAQAATHGINRGGALSAAQQVITNWTAISSGGFSITIDGVVKNVTGVNLTGVTNLNGVASQINAVLTGGTIAWNGTQFVVTSSTTGPASSVSVATAPGSGTNLAPLLMLSSGTSQRLVNGISAETALSSVATVDGMSTAWYGLEFASTNIVDADHLAIAGYIESASNKHLYGLTTSESGALDPNSTSDIAFLMAAAGYNRTFVQYSANPYAVSSFFGRAFTTNFNAINSALTLMYKVEPGVAAEGLTATQADALKAKNCNVYVNYNNGTAIIQYGTMASGFFFDEIWMTDGLANRVQTDVFNLLYTTNTKIPQTDAGMHLIVTTIENACAAYVANGFLAPGQWNAPGFGQLAQGDFLEKGYYVYAPPVATQAQADRESRASVPIQTAVKLAGAVHTSDVLINVNR